MVVVVGDGCPKTSRCLMPGALENSSRGVSLLSLTCYPSEDTWSFSTSWGLGAVGGSLHVGEPGFLEDAVVPPAHPPGGFCHPAFHTPPVGWAAASDGTGSAGGDGPGEDLG